MLGTSQLIRRSLLVAWFLVVVGLLLVIADTHCLPLAGWKPTVANGAPVLPMLGFAALHRHGNLWLIVRKLGAYLPTWGKSPHKM